MRALPALFGLRARAGPCALQCRGAPPRASARPLNSTRIPPAGHAISRSVFTSVRGKLQQTHAWAVSVSHSTHSRPPVLTSDYLFVAQNVVTLCTRACKDSPCAARHCQDAYDVIGCARKMAGG